jgi:glycosyltransferase involved in cell wall biosynthesis
MRIVAVLAVRNERPYLGNCLSHLIENGIDFAVVDNGSDDGSSDLLHESKYKPHLAGYRHLPFTGIFAWEQLLIAQQELISKIDADWILLVAPDEIMQSNSPGETLANAIVRFDAQGYDVINFDEFVFLPIDIHYVPDHFAMQPMRHYYFFAPNESARQMRAWRKGLNLFNIRSGGHVVTGNHFRLAPEYFVLRHYMFRNQEHAFKKYSSRVYDPAELARGWHWHGAGHPTARFAFPPASRLEKLAFPDDRNLSRSHPRKRPYWQWDEEAASN